MPKFLLLVLWLGCAATATAQQSTATTYRATERKVNDLVHTRLDVRFDYARRCLYGKAWLTLKPHGTATDSLRLDAKGMDIKTVAPLKRITKARSPGRLVAVYGQAGSPAQWPLMLAKYDAASPDGRFEMLGGLASMLGRLEDPAVLAQGITRIRDLTVQFKAFINSERIIGLLRQIQQQQAIRPTASEAAKLVA